MRGAWRLGCALAALCVVCTSVSGQTLTLSNGIPSSQPGHMSVEIDENALSSTGYFFRSGTGTGTGQIEFIYDYYPVFQIGGAVYDTYTMSGTWTDANPADNDITSEGSFGGVNWSVTHRLPPSSSIMTSEWTLTATQQGGLPAIRAFIYLDEDVLGFGDDILKVSGSIATGDLELLTVDQTSHAGVALAADNIATGWAADQYSDLQTDLGSAGFNAAASGSIDTQDLQPHIDPVYGQVYGPEDITVAIEWEFEAGADMVTFRVALGGVPEGVAAPTGVQATDGLYANRVRLDWRPVTGATYYDVWRNTVDDASSATMIAPYTTQLYYYDSSAASGQVYYYWVRARMGTVYSGYSLGDSGFILSPPANVAATDGTFSDRVRVTWDPATGASGYHVWRNTTNNPGTATRIATGIGDTTYDDTSAWFGTTYYYWVTSSNSSGTSSFSTADTGFSTNPTIVHIDDTNTTGNQDGTAQRPFKNIQAGIDAVADDGTVKVARGTYRESLEIDGKTVTIQGGYPGGTYPGTGDFADANRNPDPSSNGTVIDGSGNAVSIDAGGMGSLLTGFTVRNAGADLMRCIQLKRVIIRN